MIQLFDRLNQESKDLLASLEAVGKAGQTIVLEPDGFLPEGILSPFTYFVQGENPQGKALYFNQVPVPAFWEITGDNQAGAIHNITVKKAHIHYADTDQPRLVKQVDWFNAEGQTRQEDHYDRYGHCFAKTSLAVDGTRVFTRYLTVDGKERILENHVTGDILLTLQDKPIQHFRNRIDFVQFFLTYLGLDKERILVNTLAEPFLVSFYIQGKPGQDVLVWQEPLYNEIPGNMQLILEDNSIRANSVVIPNGETYARALELTPKEQHHKIFPLGYHYQFERDNFLRKDALIVTNSDQIEHLTYLVEALPDVTFRIAAVTEMSTKLTAMMAYPNVVLYQNASQQQIKSLYQVSDIYLDINYANELLSSVRQAFNHNLAIFAFRETLHNPSYVAPENVYGKDEPEKLLARIKLAISGLEGMQEVLVAQGRHSHYMDKESYKHQLEQILGEEDV